MEKSHILGLDVGPSGEPTGFAILERPAYVRPPREYEYHLRHIERFAAGTAYTTIISAVAARINEAGLTSSPLAVDLTAVGRQFLEQCWKSGAGLNLQAIYVSTGLTVQKADEWSKLVPKRDLVMALQLAMQGRRLKIAPDLSEAQLLVSELAAFRLRRVPMSETDAVEWREGRNDDLVFAVALAVWFAEKHPPFWPGSITSGGGANFPGRLTFRRQPGQPYPSSYRGVYRL